jgi:hypothetical protein
MHITRLFDVAISNAAFQKAWWGVTAFIPKSHLPKKDVTHTCGTEPSKHSTFA